jgi:large subunit ribosomal protein L21
VHAIIQDRGRQYLVHDGDTLLVDHLAQAEPGSQHVFDQVLAMGTTVGLPTIAGAAVTASIVGHEKGTKLVIQKFKRRKDYRRRNGHRQTWTRVTIASMKGP